MLAFLTWLVACRVEPSNPHTRPETDDRLWTTNLSLDGRPTIDVGTIDARPIVAIAIHGPPQSRRDIVALDDRTVLVADLDGGPILIRTTRESFESFLESIDSIVDATASVTTHAPSGDAPYLGPQVMLVRRREGQVRTRLTMDSQLVRSIGAAIRLLVPETVLGRMLVRSRPVFIRTLTPDPTRSYASLDSAGVRLRLNDSSSRSNPRVVGLSDSELDAIDHAGCIETPCIDGASVIEFHRDGFFGLVDAPGLVDLLDAAATRPDISFGVSPDDPIGRAANRSRASFCDTVTLVLPRCDRESIAWVYDRCGATVRELEACLRASQESTVPGDVLTMEACSWLLRSDCDRVRLGFHVDGDD